MNHRSPFPRFAWSVVAVNLVVILWGAVVRATGSGAGCGSHWPLCDGEVIPPEPRVATLIELTHRATSGIALLLVAGLTVWAFRAFPKGRRVRKAAVASLVFILIEAAIGAGLVIFGLVEDDASVARAVYMGSHLVNTLFLVAALTLTAVWSRETPGRRWERDRASGLMIGCLVGLLATGVSGAVSALGDTLFPSGDLATALEQDFAAGSHFLLRLRVFHPLIAVAAGLALFVLARRELESHKRSSATTRLAQGLMLAVLVQMAGGVLNIALLAPVWMQLVHLALANAVWILFVLLADALLSRGSPATNPKAAGRRMTEVRSAHSDA